MHKYKVLVEFEIEGVAQAVGSVLELSEEAAADYVADGRVELVAEDAGASSTGGSEAAA